MRLNLGAGARIMKGYVNIDYALLSGIDMLWDLNRTPWPFDSGAVSHIEAKDIFEHVTDAVLFMTECWRVLRPSGYLHIRTPHMQSPDSWDDPTHVRHCTERSFDFWIPGTMYYATSNAAMGGIAFIRADQKLDLGTIDVILRKVAS